MLETLKSQSVERHEKLQKLIEQRGEAPKQEQISGITSAESEMSDWEKRLESVDDAASQKESPAEQEKEEPKKKGFIGRKKKKKKK